MTWEDNRTFPGLASKLLCLEFVPGFGWFLSILAAQALP